MDLPIAERRRGGISSNRCNTCVLERKGILEVLILIHILQTLLSLPAAVAKAAL